MSALTVAQRRILHRMATQKGTIKIERVRKPAPGMALSAAPLVEWITLEYFDWQGKLQVEDIRHKRTVEH